MSFEEGGDPVHPMLKYTEIDGRKNIRYHHGGHVRGSPLAAILVLARE
jgi:hypothetical protein